MKCSNSERGLSGDVFLSLLKQYPSAEKYWIAYSGGMDSSVLLHLFCSVREQLAQPLEAIHVDHGLNQASRDWGKFCERQCREYALPFSIVELKGSPPGGESPEEWAREQRYRVISEKMGRHDMLFTAHHLDDQVETFFLQALRGAGPRGLAAMPQIKVFITGSHARPLLDFSREQLREYAELEKIEWLDDDSNDDPRFARNYLRHKVLPQIQDNWPAYRETIDRLIRHQKEYKQLLDEIAADDLNHVLLDEKTVIDLDKVGCLSHARQKNLLLFWLSRLNLNLPGEKHIDRILAELVNTETDKSPCVNWSGVELRRYKNRLYACQPLQDNETDEIEWDPSSPITLMGETLSACPTKGSGISMNKIRNSSFEVRYRKGGEKINPHHLSHSKTVKQLFQETSVLPWWRERIPLIYIDDELAVIPGFCVDKKFSADANEPAMDIVWSGYQKVVFH